MSELKLRPQKKHEMNSLLAMTVLLMQSSRDPSLTLRMTAQEHDT
jgi:hypothetical protein